jgi:UDP-2,3-diacylglucosamine pyrophosphatase LpxH
VIVNGNAVGGETRGGNWSRSGSAIVLGETALVAAPRRADPKKKYAVVLSDIHIGNNTPTCWYQASIHDAYLTSLLSWIVASRESVREVIFLGDMFDVWTYPSSVQPPSMRDIIAANPTLLGASGPLAALVRALPGRVRLLLGNHDGSLTAADIAQLNRSLTGNPNTGIELVLAPGIVLTGASGARTLFEHGHRWCMFNAPDPKSPWNGIPVGHFVSRGISYGLLKKHPGKTAADLPVSGNGELGLTTADKWALWRSFAAKMDLNVVEELLRHVSRRTGLAWGAPITMPVGKPSSLSNARDTFRGLFADWVRQQGSIWNAGRAVAADYLGDDLAWFALRQAMRNRADLVVMGHTHTPVSGLTVAPLEIDYVNSGFECVSKPDTASGIEFTFALVDLDAPSARLYAVQKSNGSFKVLQSRASKKPLIPRRKQGALKRIPLEDFSCYVRIENRTNTPLTCEKSSNDFGDWVVPPPKEIPPGSRADIWLQDRLGPAGSDGRVTYTDGTNNLDFAFTCPTLSPNRVSASVSRRSPRVTPSELAINYEARAGSAPWRPRAIGTSGHPVQMRCVVGVPAKGGRPPVPPQPRVVRSLPLGEKVVSGGEYLIFSRYLRRAGTRMVADPATIRNAVGRTIGFQPSGLQATVASIRVEDEGQGADGQHLRVVFTMRVANPGKSGLPVGAVIELPWRAFYKHQAHGRGIVGTRAPA